MTVTYFVPKIHIGVHEYNNLPLILRDFKQAVVVVDGDLLKKNLLSSVDLEGIPNAIVIPVDTTEEPTVEYVDKLAVQIRSIQELNCIVGIGGGSTLDIAKALSNLYTNPGSASLYQGWNLLKNKALYKIAVPTLSGTGSEASKTCVLINKAKNIKLGMNSHYSIFDELICDPLLLQTVPEDQFFYTAMDTFIHCIESLNGSHRNNFSDLFSHQALELIDAIFLSENPRSLENCEKLMLASYFGGCAIANSFVGIIHPLSAALSTVFGVRHCVGNCIVMKVMEGFYPKPYEKFMSYVSKHKYYLPQGLGKGHDEATYEKLYKATICHEKPLMNALGDSYKDVLTIEKVKSLFEGM